MSAPHRKPPGLKARARQAYSLSGGSRLCIHEIAHRNCRAVLPARWYEKSSRIVAIRPRQNRAPLNGECRISLIELTIDFEVSQCCRPQIGFARQIAKGLSCSVRLWLIPEPNTCEPWFSPRPHPSSEVARITENFRERALTQHPRRRRTLFFTAPASHRTWDSCSLRLHRVRA